MTIAVVQDRIIADLKKNKVNVLVLNKEYEGELEPNLSSVPASPKLDDYIADTIHPVKQIKAYTILLRKIAQ